MPWMPRTLVLGPGGMRGFATLGALSVLEEEGSLQRVDTWCGVSVGAIICLLMSCGYTVAEILNEGFNFDFLSTQVSSELTTLMEKQGLFTNESIRRKLATLVINKLGLVPTLSELLTRTKRSLITVTTDLHCDREEILSPSTHPSLSVIEAVLMSINVPFVFLQLYHRGTIYADGALTDPYPVNYFDDGTTNILGIYTRSKYVNLTSPLPPAIYLNKTVDLLIDSTYYYQQRECSSKCRHICISVPIDGSSSLFNLYQDREGMIEAGKREGRQFLADNLRLFERPGKYVYPVYQLNLEL